MPIGIAIIDNNELIEFCNLKLRALKHYACSYPFTCGVYIFEKFRNKGYGVLLINNAIDKKSVIQK